MDDRRKKALRQYHSDLRTGITVSHFLPKLHSDAGGFLTDVESEMITAKKSSGNVEQVDELIGILLKKEGKDFDYFCDVLEKEGHQSLSNRLKVAAGLSCDTPAARPSVIPDIMDEYVRVKREFVDVCTTRGSPTLEEVKDLCIDLIDCAFRDVPRITCQEEDIERAKTFKELARVLCFRLSKWVSYDFLRKIIAHFQPALASVKERLMHYEDQLKPFLLQKLENIAELQRREEAPGSMAELTVKYKLDADSLLLKDLATERDFLAQRLGIPEHLLQVISWGGGSIVITYWIVRDVLPLAELALCREDVRAELTQHGVEGVYLDSYPSEHPGSVDQSLQTIHLQRRVIVTVLDAHRQDMDVPSLTSDLKDMGILTAEQCQKIASLDDQERRHEALLYILLAHDGPDAYDKLVECMGLRDASIAADLQATLKDLVKSPGALSISSSSQYTLKSPEDRPATQLIEGRRSEGPAQMGLPELTQRFPQPDLEDKRIGSLELEGGQSKHDESVVHLQPEESALRIGSLEMELAEAKESQARLEEDVRLLEEELKRQLTLRDSEFHRYVELQERDSELHRYVELQGRHSELQEMYSELQERHSELQERHRCTIDEFELFKAKHAACDVTQPLILSGRWGAGADSFEEASDESVFESAAGSPEVEESPAKPHLKVEQQEERQEGEEPEDK